MAPTTKSPTPDTQARTSRKRGSVEPPETLDKPGAGLPFPERFIARHIAFPAFWLGTSWKGALRLFREEGNRIIALAEACPEFVLSEPVLIPKQVGLEDSSRYWSVTMAIEHLIEVGEGAAAIIVELSNHREFPAKVDIAKVKPRQRLTPDKAVPALKAFLSRFETILDEKVKDRLSDVRHEHPWFGPLTPHQWLCLAAMHQRIHRTQIQTILRLLKEMTP